MSSLILRLVAAAAFVAIPAWTSALAQTDTQPSGNDNLLIQPDGQPKQSGDQQGQPGDQQNQTGDQQDQTDGQPLRNNDERISNKVAEFYGIDKITGRIITFDVYINETVRFGALHVTPRVCYSRPPTVPPKTDAFVEVDEITLNRQIRRIFTGWMFADSPGLNAVEHPVYDIWLKDCKMATDEAPPPSQDPPS